MVQERNAWNRAIIGRLRVLQEIPRLLFNLKVYDVLSCWKRSALYPGLSRSSSGNFLTPILSVVLSFQVILPYSFLTICLSSACVLHHAPWCYHPNSVWWRTQMVFFVMKSCSSWSYALFHKSQYLPPPRPDTLFITTLYLFQEDIIGRK